MLYQSSLVYRDLPYFTTLFTHIMSRTSQLSKDIRQSSIGLRQEVNNENHLIKILSGTLYLLAKSISLAKIYYKKFCK